MCRDKLIDVFDRKARHSRVDYTMAACTKQGHVADEGHAVRLELLNRYLVVDLDAALARGPIPPYRHGATGMAHKLATGFGPVVLADHPCELSVALPVHMHSDKQTTFDALDFLLGVNLWPCRSLNERCCGARVGESEEVRFQLDHSISGHSDCSGVDSLTDSLAMGSDGSRKVAIVICNALHLVPIARDRVQAIRELNLEVGMQDRDTKRSQNDGHAIVLHDFEVHLVHDELLVLQRELDRGTFVFPGRLRQSGYGHDQLGQVQFVAVVGVVFAQPWLAFRTSTLDFGGDAQAERLEVDTDLAIKKRVCGDEFKLAASAR